jgi:hypothetical protein
MLKKLDVPNEDNLLRGEAGVNAPAKGRETATDTKNMLQRIWKSKTAKVLLIGSLVAGVTAGALLIPGAAPATVAKLGSFGANWAKFSEWAIAGLTATGVTLRGKGREVWGMLRGGGPARSEPKPGPNPGQTASENKGPGNTGSDAPIAGERGTSRPDNVPPPPRQTSDSPVTQPPQTTQPQPAPQPATGSVTAPPPRLVERPSTGTNVPPPNLPNPVIPEPQPNPMPNPMPNPPAARPPKKGYGLPKDPFGG